MNATAFGSRPQEMITPEGLLYDAAERVGRIREGRMALHIHLSRLLPQNRDEARIRVATRQFEAMVDVYRGQMFLLTNSDIMLICKDARLADLDAIVYKLRALFAKDPLTYTRGKDGEDRFATFYELETQYDQFFVLCRMLVDDAKRLLADKKAAAQVRELDASSLDSVIGRIGNTDIASIVRRQPCVRIAEKTYAEVVFQEFYMSIGDLQKILAPDVNLLSNRWLFQHLSQVLDLRVLSALADAGFRKMPSAFSLNLNMATVETDVFRQFLDSVKANSGLIVEFQLIDIFNNLDGFFRTRDELRARGCRTVLDGMNAITLQFLDAELYDTDFVKVTWSPDMADAVQTTELRKALGPVGFERIVLTRCDTEAAIAWGLEMGIHHFQGRFLDSMEAAVTMAQCGKASACSLSQCTQRHGVISGRLRAECANLDMLDAFPPLKALRR